MDSRAKLFKHHNNNFMAPAGYDVIEKPSRMGVCRAGCDITGNDRKVTWKGLEHAFSDTEHLVANDI